MNVAYLNGRKCEDLRQISVYNPSFLYGINVFEGIRSYWTGEETRFFDIDEHLQRLFVSVEFIKFKVSISINDLKNELIQIFQKEKIAEDTYIRITFFINSESTWSEQSNIGRLISIRSMKTNLGNATETNLLISSFNRISSRSMPPSIKAGANYLNSRYALLEAKRKGFEGALFICERGLVSESTGSCIFFIKDECVYTPSENSDILVGITRNRIISLCNDSRIKVYETDLTPSLIYSFEAAFLAGTMIEIKPISQIEGKQFVTSTHHIYKRIIELLKHYIYG
ncbi:MAG: aminotransferase class IV [Bacteroidetes bacterium]|nr:aminotransferase class IV [Bacteroidota bacterium]